MIQDGLVRRTPGQRLAVVCVAGVWLYHGIYNKLLEGSPRHLAIVQAVPGLEGAAGEYVLAAVGAAEAALALWVLSGFRPSLCAALQSAALLSMNVLELTFARDLLLSPVGLLPANLLFLALAWYAADPGLPRRMRARLQRHPVPIVARLRTCVTLTFALPAHVLARLLPPGLELDTLRGHGFVAVALVQTESLRPAGLPGWLGRDFFLAGYRIFVTCRTPDGRTIRGLHILRSHADRLEMVAGGNLLTHYRYRICRARMDARAGALDVEVRTPDGRGDLDLTVWGPDDRLPQGSPFVSLREARRFAGPLPFTLDYEKETHAVIAIEGRRTNWKPAPVSVGLGRLAFFDQPMFGGCTPVLAAAFQVHDVNYRWERGVRVPLGAETRP